MNKIIFLFSINRIWKNKNFIYTTLATFLILLLVNTMALAIVSSKFEATQIILIINIAVSMIWLSFLNINSIVNIVIKDEKTGIQGLELRRGVKPGTIFTFKFLGVKVITTIYIISTYLLFLIILASFNFLHLNILITTYSFGIFSLFAFDFLIFGLVLIISCIWKSNKKSISIGWVLTTLLAFHSIFGPIIFAFDPGQTSFNSNNVYLRNEYRLKEENQKILTQLHDEFNTLEDVVKSNIECKVPSDPNSQTCENLKSYFLGLAFDSAGMLIEFVDNFEIIQNYFKNKFKIDVEQHLEINNDKIKIELENNLVFKLLKLVAVDSNQNYSKNFKNSYYNSVNSHNYDSDQQLKQVIVSIDQKEFEMFKTENNLTWEYNSFKDLNKLIKDLFFYSTSLWNYSDVYQFYSLISDYDFFANYEAWIEDTSYSFGTYLYSLLLFEILDYSTNTSNFDYPPALGNYKFNPFMWFYEMTYFSGPNNFVNDSLVLSTSLLPVNDFRAIVNFETNEVSKRPFIVWLNYLGFISLGIIFIALSFYRFKNNIYRKAGLD